MTDKQELLDLILTANKQQTKEIKAEIKASELALTTQLKKNEKKIKQLEDRCLFLERKSRKNNIVIFGIDVQNKNELPQLTIKKLNELFDLNLTTNDVSNIYTVGRSATAPVIVEFLSFFKKQEIFKDIEKLRALKGTKIAISNDLCDRDRKEQKILKRHLKLAKENGREAKIKGLRIEIDKKLYSASELEEWVTDSEISESESGMSEEESEDVESKEERQSTSRGQPKNKLARKPNTSQTKLKGKRKRLDQKSPSPQHSDQQGYGRITRMNKKRSKTKI